MKSVLQFVVLLLLLCSGCNARPISFEPFSGKLSPQKFVPKHSPEEYILEGKNYLERQSYRKALLCFGMVTHHFPKDPLYTEALYLTGVCYFKNGQPDLAEKAFASYMQLPDADYSEELFLMKYSIAKSFAQGKRKRVFLLEGFPKLANADADALRIYDEILTAFPNKDLGAQALYLKGDLLVIKKDFSEAIKTFKKLTLQFAAHALSPKSFVRLSEIYLMQAQKEPHNVQYLNLAKINEEAIKKQHPNHPLTLVVSSNVRSMCERYASGLYTTGRFYEKKKKPHAASIYYTTAIDNYPESSLVAKCHKRLNRIAKHSS
ncbi:tetratricopeptide repeat protein [Chlamydia crocodili]|uniref:Tetratricopeptide repeat protein n=1 Tax=Chlamydia crocodili TaxID=2766982 RepID=A0ABX8CCA0_9CHLA|nr:tetratricopeptide repeat protein [Chlamydia crocodili]QVE48630.1 tetratricopeptide repeat protein [Chlamydia crocodili]